MVRKKSGNSHTTICVTWEDKEMFRKFARFVKKTKIGNMYESDSNLFHKMLEYYKGGNTFSPIPNSTYPTKTQPSNA